MKSSSVIAVTVMLVVGGTASALAADAYKLDPGSLAVQTVDHVVLRDPSRPKDILARVYYPQGDGPFPIIVFSHGFGAGKDAFAAVGTHWASHGYVSIHPQHADGGAADRLRSRKGKTDVDEEVADSVPAPPGTRLDREKLRERIKSGGLSGRGGLQGIGGSPDQIADRVRDVSAVIDALDQVEAKIPALKGKLDRKRIGVSGHSYGACVSMLIGGATIEVDGKAKSFVDPRVRCVLPISAAGSGEYGLTKDSWKGLNVPALFITGTKDVRPGHEFEWRKDPFNHSPKGDKYLLIVAGATHFHFGGGPAGSNRVRAGSSQSSLGVATDLVKVSSLAFWDTYLRDDKTARAYLADELAKFAGDKASLAIK